MWLVAKYFLPEYKGSQREEVAVKVGELHVYMQVFSGRFMVPEKGGIFSAIALHDRGSV